jgi:hypothetical protein
MEHKEKKEKIIEWSARVLLSVHFLRSLSCLIIYWQTKFQLTSSLIPEYIPLDISLLYFKASLIIGAFFIISLWFYFFRKRLIAISISAVSILAYHWVAVYFAA